MKKLLVTNVSSVVTCNDRDEVLSDVDLLSENGVITAIGKNLKEDPRSAGAETLDGSHHILYPGLVNTHHHLYQTFSRNLKEVQNMELFDWLKYLYEIWKNLDEDTVYYSSVTGMGELLKTGCTTCLDHHYVFPEGTTGTSLLGQQFRAADELGMRFYATRGSMDLSKKDGGLPPDSVTQTVDEIMKDSEEVIDRFHDPKPFAMHRVALAPCSPFSVSRTLLEESAKLARKKHVRLHTHVAETKDEENYTLEKYGVRPLAYMEQVGWTGRDVWYAHGIHFNTDELKLLAETGTGVAHCPISNMKLSSGVAKIPEMLRLVMPAAAPVVTAADDGTALVVSTAALVVVITEALVVALGAEEELPQPFMTAAAIITENAIAAIPDFLINFSSSMSVKMSWSFLSDQWRIIPGGKGKSMQNANISQKKHNN